jgi:hypothetical protein
MQGMKFKVENTSMSYVGFESCRCILRIELHYGRELQTSDAAAVLAAFIIPVQCCCVASIATTPVVEQIVNPTKTLQNCFSAVVAAAATVELVQQQQQQQVNNTTRIIWELCRLVFEKVGHASTLDQGHYEWNDCRNG